VYGEALRAHPVTATARKLVDGRPTYDRIKGYS